MRTSTLVVAAALGCGMVSAQSASAAQQTGKPATCFGIPLNLDGVDVSGDAPQARMYEVPNDGIENYMPVGSSKQGLPESIQGIWWMDGNPGGLLVTLGNATYDAATRTARLPASASGSYAFWPTPYAGCVQGAVAKKQMGFIIQFSEDYKHATLVNYTTDDNGQGVNESGNGARFTMDLEEDGHWVRHSYLFGITIPDYQLRRIVKGDGSRDTFTYDQYLKFAGKTAMIGTEPGVPTL